MSHLWNVGSTSQNTILNIILAAVRTLNLTYLWNIHSHGTETCGPRHISFSNIDQAHNGTRNTYYRTNGPHKKKYLLTRRHSQLLMRITFQNFNFVICIILNKRQWIMSIQNIIHGLCRAASVPLYQQLLPRRLEAFFPSLSAVFYEAPL
jgi:hypothetical protein